MFDKKFIKKRLGQLAIGICVALYLMYAYEYILIIRSVQYTGSTADLLQPILFFNALIDIFNCYLLYTYLIGAGKRLMKNEYINEQDQSILLWMPIYAMIIFYIFIGISIFSISSIIYIIINVCYYIQRDKWIKMENQY